MPVPRYKELGVKPIWTFIKEIPELLQYFPNLEKDELPDRSFMWTILSTLRYDEWKQLIWDVRNARSKCDEENNGELIEIDPEFLNKLMTTPVLSAGKLSFLEIISIYCRKGKNCYLLKSSRQEKFARKKPKEFKSSLGVLKSKKEDRASIRTRSSLHEEEEKKESEEMNVDTTQRRGSASAFGDHPPPKAFSASKFASKQSKDRDEERLEF